MTIIINKSQAADTRSCDYKNVSIDTLLEATKSHISDVGKAMDYFGFMCKNAGLIHDNHKVITLEQFHAAFKGGFKDTTWWTQHRKETRHHLLQDDGIPTDVNLIDVLECLADCVVAGMARTGTIYEIKLPDEVLQRAFKNTIDLLKNNIEVQ